MKPTLLPHLLGLALVSLPLPGRAADSMNLLHFRWQNGAISLVKTTTVAAKVKPSRSQAADAAARGLPGVKASPAPHAASSPFSYTLLSDSGMVLVEKSLPDPTVVRVELQDSGATQLHSYTEKRDSADFWVKVPAGEAKSIRFFRNPFPNDPLRKHGAVKTPIAEFQLP